MSFSFLPWPIYVIIMTCIGLAFIVYAVKSKKEYPTLVNVAFALFGIGGIFAAVLRYAKNAGILADYVSTITTFTVSLVFGIGVPMLMIGGYQKVKDDPEQRRIMLICIIGLIVIFLLVGLLAVWETLSC